jgi:hypothetical protein
MAKIDLGHGAHLEPDSGPRNTAFHKRIIRTAPVPNTKVGHYCDLECGHRVMTFGNLAHCAGVVLCDQCRTEDARRSQGDEV